MCALDLCLQWMIYKILKFSVLYQYQFTTVSLWPTITDFRKLVGVSKVVLE